MAEGDLSSGIKIEIPSSNSSLSTTLRSSEIVTMWYSKDEGSKSVSKLKESEEDSLEVNPHKVCQWKGDLVKNNFRLGLRFHFHTQMGLMLKIR